MTTLLRLLFPRTYKRIMALGWLEGVQYELATASAAAGFGRAVCGTKE